MKLAEEIRKEQADAYEVWKEKNNKYLTGVSRSYIKQYGHASVTCHRYGEYKPSEREFIKRWCKENGFSVWDSCNVHGANIICWN